MAHIRIACPDCGMKLKVSPEHIGKTGRCSKCGARFRIERPSPMGQASTPSASSDPASDVTQAEATTGSSVDVTQAEPTAPDVTASAEQTVVEGPDPIEATMAEGPLADAAPSAEDAEARQAAEDDVPSEWNISDVILDTYEVKHIHEGGAMGKVYRVHHTGWNMDLAVKSPRDGYFHTQAQKDTFIDECQTWINLGLHPHIVSCYYVRTLGGIPRVFAEYIEGGDLKDWIDEKKLYEGDHDPVLKRMLDIAIQFAWGLHYAHEREAKFVHQDVKPGNVMMTPDGEAKVSDFGLAKARGNIDDGVSHGDGQQSILVSTGGMTPAFCSPEQANKQPLSRKTDIWSWGVSVLQMFTGEITWPSGTVAASALDGYVETGAEDESIPKMPDALVDLLRRCFQQDPDNRPQDMAEVAGKLKEIYEDPNTYKEPTSDEYPREEPKAAELLADGLNNRAVSMLDLGRKEEAEELFEQALKADPHHPEATYNRGLILWRAGKITDDELVAQLSGVEGQAEHTERLKSLLGRVHLERGDYDAARTLLRGMSDSQLANELRGYLAATDGNQGAVTIITALSSAVGKNSSAVFETPDRRLAILRREERYLELAARDNSVDSLNLGPGRIGAISADMSLALVTDWGDIMKVLAGSYRAEIRLVEVSTGRTVRTLNAHTSWACALAFSFDGHLALSGGGCPRFPRLSVGLADLDRSVILWDLSSGRRIAVLDRTSEDIVAVGFSSDPDIIWAADSNDTLYLWAIKRRRCLRTVKKGHPVERRVVAMGRRQAHAVCHPRSHALASANVERVKALTAEAKAHISRGEHALAYRECGAALSIPGLERNGDLLLLQREIGQYGKATALRDAWESWSRPTRGLTAAFSPDNRLVITGGNETVQCLDVATGDCAWSVPIYKQSMNMAHAACFSPDGSTCFVADREVIRRVNPADGATLGEIYYMHRTGQRDGAIRWRFTNDGRYVVVTFYGRHVDVYELSTGRRVVAQGGFFATDLAKATLSDDMSTMLCATQEGNILVARSGHDRPCGHVTVESVADVAFLPGNESAAVLMKTGEIASWDGELSRWEGAKAEGGGKCLEAFAGGTHVVSGGKDGIIRLWDMSALSCSRELHGHAGSVSSIAVSRNGQFVLSCSGDEGIIRLWELTWDFEFPGPSDWDDGARPYAEAFVRACGSASGSADGARLTWTKAEFQIFLSELKDRGYGWLRPEGVRKRLAEMATSWTALPRWQSSNRASDRRCSRDRRGEVR